MALAVIFQSVVQADNKLNQSVVLHGHERHKAASKSAR
jgi:hypothetical protein